MRIGPLLLAPLLAAFGCTGGSGGPDPEPDGLGNCDYPPGASEPMAAGGVLTPYRWPTSLDAARNDVPLDLADAPCATSDVIDWSPFDVLLFVSIPAW